MNIKALIKKYEAVECVVGIVSGKTILKTVLRDLEQLDEPQKVKVPQFVAEWIEEARKACKDVAELFEFDFTNDEVRKWFMQERPFDLVARAWLDGYESWIYSQTITKVRLSSGSKLKDIWEVRFGQKEPNNSTKRLSRV